MTTQESDETQKSELSTKIGNPARKSDRPYYGNDVRTNSKAERGGSDMDMAASILFLVSKAGLFYNNQLLHPDGGQILKVPAAM